MTQEVPDLQAAIAEVRRVAELVKNTQPIWRENLLVVCDAAEAITQAVADAQRLDWLERQTVVVTQSRRYGSTILFTAIHNDEEDPDKRTDLRAKVDEAMRQGAQHE
jgi:hypothetical protein